MGCGAWPPPWHTSSDVYKLGARDMSTWSAKGLRFEVALYRTMNHGEPPGLKFEVSLYRLYRIMNHTELLGVLARS